MTKKILIGLVLLLVAIVGVSAVAKKRLNSQSELAYPTQQSAGVTATISPQPKQIQSIDTELNNLDNEINKADSTELPDVTDK